MKKQEKRQNSNLQFLLKEAGKEKYKLYFSAFLSVISAILAIIPYILMYQIIIELLGGDIDYLLIKNLAIKTALAVVIRLMIFILSGVCSHVAAFTILYDLRMKCVNHMSKLNMGFFTDHSVGEIKKTINEDIEKLEQFIAHQIPDLASAVVAPIIFLIFLMTLNFKLSLVLFIPIILGIIAQSGAFKGYDVRIQKYHNLLEKLNTTIVEYINGMSVMKAFNLSAESFDNYKNTTEEYTDYWQEITRNTVPYYAVFLALIDTGLLFIIPIGGIMYLNGSIDIATYVLFLILSANFLTSFKSLLEFGGNFSMLLEGAGKVREILETPTQVSGNKVLSDVKGDILFDNVTFAYKEKDVLKNINLNIKPNSTIALVGPSGSGKTTIGKLVGRYWDVNQGSIKIDNTDIRDFTITSLMDNMGFVFQDVFILEDTILENIKMDLNKTYDEIIEASKKAQIHDFIMSLPDQYDTVLGEKGIKLSGGEKQRISIARAILKNPPIIILDEVTSYSDVENESKIQEALKTLLKGKTGIIIAHRLYTIKNVDEIIVLDEGEIIEKGTHNNLLEQNGLYSHLWKLHGYEEEVVNND